MMRFMIYRAWVRIVLRIQENLRIFRIVPEVRWNMIAAYIWTFVGAVALFVPFMIWLVPTVISGAMSWAMYGIEYIGMRIADFFDKRIARQIALGHKKVSREEISARLGKK